MKPVVSSRRVLLSLAAAHVLAGVALSFESQVPGAGQAAEYLLFVLTVIAIYVWCRAEAAERGTFSPGRSALWSAIFPLVFLPVYFFRTRRVRPALVLSVKAYALYVALSLLCVATATALAIARGA